MFLSEPVKVIPCDLLPTALRRGEESFVLLLRRAVAPAGRCLQTAAVENAEAAAPAVDQTCFPELAYGNRYACSAHAEHCGKELTAERQLIAIHLSRA